MTYPKSLHLYLTDYCGKLNQNFTIDSRTVLNLTSPFYNNYRYPKNLHCLCTIKAATDSNMLLLRFSELFNLDNGFDFIRLYYKKSGVRSVLSFTGYKDPRMIFIDAPSFELRFDTYVRQDENFANGGFRVSISSQLSVGMYFGKER